MVFKHTGPLEFCDDLANRCEKRSQESQPPSSIESLPSLFIDDGFCAIDESHIGFLLIPQPMVFALESQWVCRTDINTYPITSSSVPAYSVVSSSSSPTTSCDTELYSADAWFLWIAKRVAMTSSGQRIPTAKTTKKKYSANLSGENSGFSSVMDGRSTLRRGERISATMTVCATCAALQVR